MSSKAPAVFFLLLLSFSTAPAQTLDTTTFIVMGEGLAAGMANYGLSSVVQNYSFPAQIAARMNTAFPQPLIQPPGIGDVIGYPAQEVRLQTYPQGSVRQFYQPDPSRPPAPPLFVLNLSVPGLTLADSITLRPQLPIAQKSMKQTVVNMLLGFPSLFFVNPSQVKVPQWTQFEYAKEMNPTVALVELGFYEAIDAAINLDPGRMPDPAAFGTAYGTILAGLRDLQAQVIATTIPNPLDTAYFSSPVAAAAITATTPLALASAYHISPQDFFSRNALTAISGQLATGTIDALPPGSVLTAAQAADISARVNALNAQVVTQARNNGAVLYDLNAFLHAIKVSGISAGAHALTADYLGGFYSMDAVYPGITGHSLIASDLLAFLNRTYHRSFAPIDVASIAASDTALLMQRPSGELHTAASLGIHETRGRNQ